MMNKRAFCPVLLVVATQRETERDLCFSSRREKLTVLFKVLGTFQSFLFMSLFSLLTTFQREILYIYTPLHLAA